MQLSTLLLVAAFVAGLAGGSLRSVRLSGTAEAVKTLLLPGQPAKCADIYAGYPLSPMYRVEELQPARHPIPGLAHITVHGRRQHGVRGIELWMETFAAGASSPIHQHDCEEILLFVSGSGMVAMQGKGGQVLELAVGPNSTVAVLPGARHQIINNSGGDLHFIVAIDNAPFQPVLFKSWSDPDSAGTMVSPMLWDQACPEYVPESLKHLVVPAPASQPAAGGSSEL